MAFVVVTFMIVAFMAIGFMVVPSSGFSRIRLRVVFEGVRRTQRFTFQAPPAPIELPLWRFPGRKLSIPACRPTMFT
jgi:hypothetical protein